MRESCGARTPRPAPSGDSADAAASDEMITMERIDLGYVVRSSDFGDVHPRDLGKPPMISHFFRACHQRVEPARRPTCCTACAGAPAEVRGAAGVMW